MKFLRVLFFFLLVFTVVDAHAQGSSSELKRRRDELNKELQQLNDEYQQTASNKKASQKQLYILKEQIALREQKIDNINSDIRNLDNQISENNNTVHTLQGQLNQLKKQYAAMILFAYRNQSSYNKLMFLFASQDFNQAYKRLKYLQQIGTYRQRQADYIQGTQQDLHVKINELDKTKQEKDNLLKDQENEKKTLGNERNSQVKVVADLSQQVGQLKQQQRDLQRKIVATNREIDAAIRREIEEAKRKAAEEAARIAAAKARAENKDVGSVKSSPKASTSEEALNATPEAAKLSNDFLGNRGRLPWPVANGFIIQGFGPYYTQGIRSESDGVDIKSNPDANVRAVFDGDVIRVADISGTYMVLIRHGEYFTAYSNLKSVNVAKGTKVNTKQIIGTVATDPSTGITEVHFGLYKGVTAVDPKIWLTPN